MTSPKNGNSTNCPCTKSEGSMGALRLQSYLNSSYIEAANHLQPQHAPHRVVAYVESFDDIFFWRSVLQEFETETLRFEVMLPSRQSLCKGKKVAMMNNLGPQLGNYMIACVDADYDWLLQGASPTGHTMLHNPFIFHTYAYAIENYQCYAPGLHTACVMSTLNDHPVMDFEAFLADYSRIVWPLLVWNVWAYANGAYKEFAMADFCEIVGFHDIHFRKAEVALNELKHRVNKQINWLQHHFPKARKTYPIMRQHLLDLGVKPEECYLYIQGHTLFDNVVLPLLTPICELLRREREREIEQLASHETQRQNEMSCYHHSISPIDVMLRKSNNYRSCPLYQRMRSDIARFIQEQGLKNA